MKPLALLYPEHCIMCRSVIAEENRGLCPSCRTMARAEMCNMICEAPKGVDKLICASRYQGKLGRAVINFKFYQRYAHAIPLAEVMAEAWELRSRSKPDVITYVPISALRAHTRGYNQSEEHYDLLTYQLRWVNNVKEEIVYQQSLLTNYNAIIDTEKTPSEQIHIEHGEAIYFKSNNKHTLIWNNGSYTFKITCPSSITVYELTKLANSVK